MRHIAVCWCPCNCLWSRVSVTDASVFFSVSLSWCHPTVFYIYPRSLCNCCPILSLISSSLSPEALSCHQPVVVPIHHNISASSCCCSSSLSFSVLLLIPSVRSVRLLLLSNTSKTSSASSLLGWASSINHAALEIGALSLCCVSINFVVVAGVPSPFCAFSRHINVY